MGKFKSFCKKQGVEPSAKAYFIDAMGAMAKGLFASLLIGTILKAIGLIPSLEFFSDIGGYAQKAVGCAMAVAIGYSLKAPMLVTLSLAGVGFAANTLGGSGGPLAVFIIAIVACEIGKLVANTTKVDIIVTPLITVAIGGGLSMLIAGHIGTLVGYIGNFISWSMERQPLVMGILVSVVIGIVLTLPISSAAICMAIGITGFNAATGVVDPNLGLAGGAAVAGCCAQMVGFAVMSYKENGIGGLLSQGLGTSMLQMPNIIRRPAIWLSPIIVSAITGPLATCVFKLGMYSDAVNSGMGTCGLMGPIGVVLGWFGGHYPDSVTFNDWFGMLMICIFIPAILCPILNSIFIRLGLYKGEHLKL